MHDCILQKLWVNTDSRVLQVTGQVQVKLGAKGQCHPGPLTPRKLTASQGILGDWGGEPWDQGPAESTGPGPAASAVSGLSNLGADPHLLASSWELTQSKSFPTFLLLSFSSALSSICIFPKQLNIFTRI